MKKMTIFWKKNEKNDNVVKKNEKNDKKDVNRDNFSTYRVPKN